MKEEIEPQRSQTPKPTKEQMERALTKIVQHLRAEKLKPEAQTQDKEVTNDLKTLL